MAIDFVRSGDTLVVWRLDRLGRNMEDLISIVNRPNAAWCEFIVFKKILRWTIKFYRTAHVSFVCGICRI